MTRFEEINQLVADIQGKLQEAIRKCEGYITQEEEADLKHPDCEISMESYKHKIALTKRSLNALLELSDHPWTIYTGLYHIGEEK